VNYGPIPTVTVADLPNPLPEGLVVLDVREEVEWRHGHIEGATHIPLMELADRLDEVPHEQTLVVCKVGGRSAHAVAYLTHTGREAVNLAGGMIEWLEAGRPMVSDNGQHPRVV
jgi:rhodanese-related sulfurtransferase